MTVTESASKKGLGLPASLEARLLAETVSVQLNIGTAIRRHHMLCVVNSFF